MSHTSIPFGEELSEFPFLKKFESEELQFIAERLERREYQAGSFLLVEDTFSDDLFLLIGGVVEVCKIEGETTFVLAEISKGEVFGEIAFLDLEGRSASVKAKTDVEVLVLKKERLKTLPKDSSYLLYKLSSVLGQVTLARLRQSSKKILQEIELRTRFGRFTLLLITSLILVTLLTGFIKFIKAQVPFHIISLVMGVLIGALAFLVTKSIKKPWHEFGLTLANWPRVLLESLVICALIVAFYFLVFPNRPTPIDALVGLGWLKFSIYLIVAFSQEFISRGVLQTGLEHFYEDRHGWVSVCAASLIFSITHVIYGFVLTVASFAAGIALGFLFRRHRSLLGVTLIHFLLGILGVSLGLLSGLK